MDKDKLIKRLMATFVEELDEHVAAFNRDLLALEKGPAEAERAERLKTLFRSIHSLKGAARSVNLGLIEGACHRLEEILAAARDGQVPLDPGRFSVLFAAADAIEEAGMRLREQQDLSDAPLATLLPRLDAAAHGAVSPAAEVESRRSPGQDRAMGASAPAAPPPASPRAPAAEGPDPGILPRGEPGKPADGGIDGAGPTAPAAQARAARVEPAPSPPRDGDGSAPVAAPPVVGPAAARPPGGELPPAGAGGGATVRVPAEKLDTLLARSGELLVIRRRVESRADQTAVFHESVGRWKEEWRAVEDVLDKLLPESLNGDGAPRLAAGGAGLVPRRAAVALQRTGDRLRQLEKDLDRLVTAMVGDGRLLDQAADSLDDEVRRLRMLPFAEACQGLDRMVRDLAHAGGKEVELVIEGGAVELDRSVLEGLKDPLRHLVRNAVDHGADRPPARRAAGKPPVARITVAAALRGAQVEVVVADDGRGLDINALRDQARKRKLPESLDERELAQLIFLPGLSTAPIITDISGRGVGLDVVKSQVESLHGTVDLSWTPGRGTRFTLAVPLTLTTLRALLVGAGGQTFAFAGTNVQKLARVDPADFRSVEGRPMLALGGTPVPVAVLVETLGLRAREPAGAGGKVPVLIVAAGEKRMGFVVEEFLAAQEIVVKGLGARIRRVRNVSGATILPEGQIALVLNAAHLVRTALSRASAALGAATPARAAAGAKKRVLVADDSLTTRTLEKSILEAAGYEVAVAVDGAAAWQVLQEHGADLLVSDVDMPRMDGFALTEAVRGSKRFHDLPVVLVTARDTDQDKARGIEVGADAYLGKSAFDQKNLLETIAQLL